MHNQRGKRDLHVERYGELAQVFHKFRNVKVDYSKNTVLNLELLETETVSLDVILPSRNHQDVIEISSGQEDANVITNLGNKSLERFGN